MDVQQFATSDLGMGLWMGIGRWVPRRAGYWLARSVAAALSRRRESSLYRILYSNQAGVLSGTARPEEVHLAVSRMLNHAGMASYDLMYCLARGGDEIARTVDLGGDPLARIDMARSGGKGVVVCACHLSNFNLAAMALALGQVRMLALTAAETRRGFRIMSELRAGRLLEEAAISQTALREAVARLRRGDMVGIGVDWPLDLPPSEWLPFFGRPARLSTSYVRLAMAGDAVLVPMACRWRLDRGYYLEVAPHMELELTGDRASDVRHNALRVLSVFERWIAETPEQWLMYHSVWA